MSAHRLKGAPTGVAAKKLDGAAGPWTCFAVVAPGLEPLAAAHARRLGLADVQPVEGGVTFTGDITAVARANVGLPVVSRVLVRAGSFRAATFHELIQRASALPWERFVPSGAALGIRVACHKSRLRHSGAVAERVLEAVGRRLGWTPRAVKPSEEEDTGARQVLVRVENDEVTVSVDTSGALLHQRGWRRHVSRAPLRETLGDAMLDACGWVPGMPLWDPFCGSGTLPLLAALRARGVPPGAQRGFAFESWPGTPAGLVKRTGEALRGEDVPTWLLGTDRDARVLEAAAHNAADAGVKDARFGLHDVMSGVPTGLPGGPGVVVTNPPYGERLSLGEAGDALQALVDVMEQHLPTWGLCVILPPQLLARMDVAWDGKLSTRNGGLPVTVAWVKPVT